MRSAVAVRLALVGFGLSGLLVSSALAAERGGEDLARKAQAVLREHCHRCHGQEGAVEGGMNYVLDRAKLVARKKIIPGRPDLSSLYRRVARGKMPPPGEAPRPGAADLLVLKQWIEAGAPATSTTAARQVVSEAEVYDLILADLDKQERRTRRFLRYFSLAPLANAGAGPDELATYRRALAKLLNSLSWHPRITLPVPVDPAALVLRIDLRDFQWDAGLWNRLLAEYPYGILHDTAVARAVLVATSTRLPCVRLDWFVANASRPPLYYDLLQLPGNAADLEKQLRVDAGADVQQERVARAGFNGSGVSRNNRVIERHDAQTGAYWRTYDFDAVPQNLAERDNLLPDRRNLFAYPLGPGGGENTFQHAGGEIIFNLPNGLQGYFLVNADNQRINKGPTAIVSDARRPDRAVEVGVSCIGCHVLGINPKDDQVRDHVARNLGSFSRADTELVRSLYAPRERMRALMEEDAERFRKAVEKTGNKVTAAEVVLAMTQRYEADVDLPTLAAETGVSPEELRARLLGSDDLARNLGALKVTGGTVARQVAVQAFGDVVRAFRLGTMFRAGSVGESLPDNTGEVDPLEAQSNPANAAALSPDGRLAAFAAGDKSVRLWDVEAARDLRRCIGHTASVWCVAFAPDGRQLLSGGKDGTVRLWEVETGRELLRLEGHTDLVTGVAFRPDGRRALSVGYDHQAILWDLEKGKPVPSFAFDGGAKYLNAVGFSPDGNAALVCAGRTVYLVDAGSGKVRRRLEGHGSSVVSAVFSADGQRVLSGGDDRTLRLWDTATGKELRCFRGHESWVKAVALSPDGRQALSGGSDTTVRLWDVDSGKELRAFRKHTEPLVAVTFGAGGRQTLSVSRDAEVRLWQLPGAAPPVRHEQAVSGSEQGGLAAEELRPLAVIPVGGTVGSMYLHPDRRSLFYLNLTEATLGRVDTHTARVERTLRLAEGTDALSLSPDGRLLAALAPVGDGSTATRLQVIDPSSMSLRKSFDIPISAYDVAATDAGLVLVSGRGDDWTDITAIDLEKGTVVARWGGVWARSFLQLAPDRGRVYYSSQGVRPGTLDALILPRRFDDSKPITYRSPAYGQHALGGEFLLSPDGQFLLCKTGTVLRLAAAQEEDLRFHADVGRFLAAAVAPEMRAAFVLTAEGLLKTYAYPDFKLQATQRLGLTPYQAVCDGRGKHLYVVGLDPRRVAERPRARGHGDIHVYALPGRKLTPGSEDSTGRTPRVALRCTRGCIDAPSGLQR